MKNFALIGASGYIAPRHMRAIKDTGNNLIAALDPYDGIGVMDSHFPEASFFTEFERFDRFVDKWHRDSGKRIEFVSICSPNYLHDSHIRFALKNGAATIKSIDQTKYQQATNDCQAEPTCMERSQNEGSSEACSRSRPSKIGKEVLSVDSRYFRPTEVELLIGDPTKAKTKLGWEC